MPAGFFSQGDFPHLELIDLSTNHLKTIELSLQPVFPKLKSLDLSYNYLERVPSSFQFFTSLRTLNLIGNPLSQLPAKLGNIGLKSLKIEWLSHVYTPLQLMSDQNLTSKFELDISLLQNSAKAYFSLQDFLGVRLEGSEFLSSRNEIFNKCIDSIRK